MKTLSHAWCGVAGGRAEYFVVLIFAALRRLWA
jgi:hypothetical protein